MLKNYILIVLGTLIFNFLGAQAPPSSNIYLFDLEQVSDSIIEIKNPRYLTGFNPDGYNNQPSFFNETELYITVQFPYERQTDIYVLDLENKTRSRVTATAEGEYSPMRMPDYYSFSTVRQEISLLDTVQRIWQFPVDRLSNGKPLFKYVDKVGYYLWLSSYQVAMFIVDSPNYLGIADTRTDKVEPIATNTGRCFRKMSNGNLAYVQKRDYGRWSLMEKSLYRGNSQPVKIIDTIQGSEDFTILADGTFIMGNGSKLFKFNPYIDEDWVEFADLRFYEIRNITRLAVSEDNQLAVVAN